MFTPYEQAGIKLLEMLNSGGKKSLFAGGYVRDKLMNRDFGDIDIATQYTPDEVMALLPGIRTIPTGIEHGTVTAIVDDFQFEITTLRIDGDYGDGRRPDTVEFTESFKADATRRDFTINAMFYNPITNELFDYFDGEADIKSRLIRAVGEPRFRFLEDGLRPIRALRFAATLGFRIEDKTLSATQMKSVRATVSKVAAERIREETMKSLAGDYSSIYPELLQDTKLADFVMPELYSIDRQFRFYTFDRMTEIPSTNSHARMAYLISLFEQPKRQRIVERLLFSNRETKYMMGLASGTDKNLDVSSDGEIRRTLDAAKLNGIIPTDFADFYETRHGKRGIPDKIREMVYNDRALTPKLAVTGDDIMSLGFTGKTVGKILNELYLAVSDDLSINNRMTLMDRVKYSKIDKAQDTMV